MNVGFAVVSTGRDVRFHHFGPCNTERRSLLAFYHDADHAAVLMGRLHYRRSLLDSLRSPPPVPLADACASNDAALALAAYRQEGTQGLERLEGDATLVLWDARTRRLIGWRDPLGGYPLFWIEHDGVIAFGTGFSPLLDLLHRRTLDLEYLAEFLTIPGPVNERASERCAYEGIRRVRAGSIASVQLPTGSVEQRRYWDWQERLVDPGTERLEEVGEQLGVLLRSAVRERIRGRTAAHLSGGMDSTAVSLIARDWLVAGVGEAPLHTLSLRYERLPGLARETPYLNAALRQQTGIVPHFIAADDLLDFDSFADPPRHDEPYVGLWRLGMDRATVTAAAEHGAETLLTGLGADEILDVQPFI